MSLINVSRNTSHRTVSSEVSRVEDNNTRFAVALVAAALGLIVLFGVGFAQGTNGVIHNAAHDTRHSMAFPCH